jgi:gamma-glutamyltranspeptidase/glutathione hydrolase
MLPSSAGSAGPFHIRRHVVLAFALLVAVAAPAGAREPEALAKAHMVATANPMATDAGLAILRAGGSAIDAAVAVQMVLGVVEPQASGIGGGGFLVFYDARSRQVTSWDGRETAPAGAGETLFLGADGKPLAFPLAVVSGLSVGVPGAVRMLEAVHRRHGRLPWRQLFVPAIKLAEDGFPVPPRLARALAAEIALRADPQARTIYFHADGSPWKEGETLRNPALADTMRLLADKGADALYSGPLAEAIVAAVGREPRPGSMTAADLAGYRPLQRTPLCRDASAAGPSPGTAPALVTICGMGPPTSGTVAVLQVLRLAAWYGNPAAPPSPPADDHCDDYVARHPRENPGTPPLAPLPDHELAEAERLAFADRGRWVADPGFVAVPVDGLLDDDYLEARRAQIALCRSLGMAKPGQPPGAPALPPASPAVKPEAGTTHMAIVDRDGNVVSFTTTIESPFGARRMVGGFLLNNELTDFSLLPSRGGRPAANRVQPGKRPRSSMTPLVALDRDGRFLFALGSAGGSRIIGDVAQTTLRLLRNGSWTMQAAIAAPRLINRNGVTEVEVGPAAEAQAARLRALGHEVTIRRHDGGLQGIRARYDDGGTFIGYEGGADPRRDGSVAGD